MSPEKTKYLYDKYPKIFVQHTLPITESAMGWNFQFEDGWYFLTDQLCSCIQSYIDFNEHLKIPQVEATTVKEKFGTLRFYYTGGNETIHGMVWLAEYMSAYICESCGTTENVSRNNKGYIQTFCDNCRNKKEREINENDKV